MEQELAVLEPKYGKYVEVRKSHRKKSPSPEITPRLALNGVKTGAAAKDTVALLKQR